MTDCALIECGHPATSRVAHPYRPEPSTPLCERHATAAVEETGATRWVSA